MPDALYQSLLDRGVSCVVDSGMKTRRKRATVLTVALLGSGFEMGEENYLVFSEHEIFRT